VAELTEAPQQSGSSPLQRTPEVERENRNYLVVLLALTSAVLWLLPISSSLWLDETGTFWIVKDGLRQTFDRALRFQGQSPAYFVIEWFARRLGGHHEVALRLPSLVAMAVAAYLLFRLARNFFDQETALLAILVFVSFGSVAFAAVDARPYPFALAAAIAATLQLVRWLERGRFWDGVGYAFLAALMVYFHLLFGAVLLAHLVYAVRRRRAGSPVRWLQMSLAAAGVALLLLPLLVQLHSLVDQRRSLSFPTDLSVPELFRQLAPATLVTGLLAGILIAGLADRISFRRFWKSPDGIALGVAWAVIPTIGLWVAAHVTSTSIFATRYILSATPGIALLGGASIRSVAPSRGRRIVALVVALTALLANANTVHYGEDWRGAIRAANAVSEPSSPVLLNAGLIESNQLSWLRDPEKASYLDGPAAEYPVRGRLFPLPYSLGPAERMYLEALTQNVLLHSGRFVLITRYANAPFAPWLTARLPQFSIHPLGQFGFLTVTLFARSASAA
jgi:4-amino-4-deoxy-L-arabinose transferase-like glycosyltransferase